MKNVFRILKKEFPNIQNNVLMKNHTTFKIGGPAEYFLIVRKREDLMKAIKVAKKLTIPVFILGGGSNLLVSDKGFSGLVIKIELDNLVLKKKNTIISDAGVTMQNLVNMSLKNSLVALEWAGGLPGTVGGAVRGNAGAFGGEVKDSILSVEALDKNLQLRKLSNTQCQFSYRSSIFKKKNWTIVSVVIKCKKGDKKTLQEIANSHIKYRKEKHPLEYPNAGSVFKNVDFKKIPLRLQNLFLDKVKKDPFLIVPSAWFIIGAGLTGKKIGKAQISKKHSNYIVNLGGAKAKDVAQLITFAKEKIKEKYGVSLEQEIQYLQ
ncbi:MAG: UDP-N-acetylenolpyruvoylglucosamine reductase [Parcubacteria group bacterium GW2011_GWA2_33_14]|uniref:UDP-N-acetylenolpyruvoylglucosamine reductase n=1 Tax=Candidatus Staskawiczbacteria bacterium RIFCSPHIGHO2_02_FULL_33_16 TaxID=1802204 RepID=A0A1G2HWU5_9BACT|nr:MAG: UDP-N-acetylenolpyruvoylglucosamine reductase [Parcubacteria group bacterium GW2011_GWA2_33_14]OGZ67016.1 MAG: UDP-N-acetylenolpyruvoylglucosamine reductase [Candidatus Staskawiczbacteria bacterium RIFCSPHIGHO2_02_FULL_33_16]OGZ71079.1 MAG: UDP-N-acetylenolpyruvoylglucosamine reductase [Candidatus Staskawiczbacteria bacterium RIFCSPLOWO2_01_FULL_33_13]